MPTTVAESGPRPGRKRKPIGWSTISIAVLVAVSAALVYRRDGAAGVWEILKLTSRGSAASCRACWPVCLLGAFITEILPHEKCRDRSGRIRGLKGLLIGAAFGAILPGGPSPLIRSQARCSRSAPISARPSPWW